jgi:hypothetical protein
MRGKTASDPLRTLDYRRIIARQTPVIVASMARIVHVGEQVR